MVKDDSLKKILQLLFAGLLINSGLTSCKVVDKFTQFELKYETSVTVPASAGINLPFNIFTPPITTNSSSVFESNNTKKELIEEITLKSMILEIETPAGEDFSFLQSISLFISAEGLQEVKMAWKDPVPNPVGGKIDLNVSGEDLQEYIKKDNYSLRISTTTDELLSEDHVIKVTCNFFVDAKLINN